MLLNELLQWAVLLGVAVFVVGLTRQLGDFLIPPRDRVAHNSGPDVGERLPQTLLPEAARKRMTALMSERASDWAAVVVVSGECTRCTDLLIRLRDEGAPGDVPVVGLSMTDDAAHRTLLEEAVDIAVVDPDGLDAAALHVKPFVLVVDARLRIRHKQIAADLREVAEVYAGDADGAPAAHQPLTIVKAGG